MNKKQKIQLLFAVAATLIIKSLLSFKFYGTYFYSDEACVVAKAHYFAENLKMAACSDILKAPAGNPMPLTSLIFSPLYMLFESKMHSYYGILILHSLMLSSLIYPIYSITGKFIKKHKTKLLIALFIVFLPQVTTYEKTTLTETTFIFLNIWFLYFYIKQKTEKNHKKRNLIISIIIALLGALSRPFGFIMILAMAINEILTSKNKKKLALILIPLTSIAIIIALLTTSTAKIEIFRRLSHFTELESIKLAFVAIKNQFNSLIVTTYLVPLIIIASYLPNKKDKSFNKIKFYFFSIIILNFLISANHIHGYLFQDKTANIITRYINLMSVLIILFASILVNKIKTFKLNKYNLTIVFLSIISLVFFKFTEIKHSLNLDISIFYDTDNFLAGNIIKSNGYIGYYFIPVIIILIILLFENKKRLYIIFFSTLLLSQSAVAYIWHSGFNYESKLYDNVYNTLKSDEDLSILLLQKDNNRIANPSFWNLKSLSNINIDLAYVHTYSDIKVKQDLYKKTNLDLSQYDYILSSIKFELPISRFIPPENYLYFSPQGKDVYEHIKILKENNIKYENPILNYPPKTDTNNETSTNENDND